MFNQFKACNYIQVSRLKVTDALWVINSADLIVMLIYTYSTESSTPIYLFKSANIKTNYNIIEELYKHTSW